MKALKFLGTGVLLSIISGLIWSTVGGSLISDYYAMSAQTFRPMGIPLLSVGTPLLSFVDALFYIMLFLIVQKVMPGDTKLKKGLAYGFIMFVFGGALMGMLYNFLFFNMHPTIAAAWVASAFLVKAINGALVGLIYGE